MFILFVILTIIFFLSPVIIHIPCVRSLMSNFLKELYNYKQTYLGIIGTTLGTGLVVSSAVWLQRNNINKKENEDRRVRYFKEKQAAKVIDNWVRREIHMLWGMFIWAKFDLSVFSYNGIDLPFEPYCIEKSKVFDCYLLIDYKISDSSRDIFYEFFYLAEKVNQYIENYNRMNFDILEIGSTGNYGGSINISSGVTENRSSQRYKNILKSIIEGKKKFLFNEDLDIMSGMEYLIDKSKLNNKINELINNLQKDSQGSHKQLNYFEIEQLIKNKVETPKKYEPIIKEIREIKESIKELDKNYECNKEKYYEEVEKPLMNSKIEKLLDELKCIFD